MELAGQASQVLLRDVQVHPLYQSNLLPILFLTSTIGMGYAAVTIEGAICRSGSTGPSRKRFSRSCCRSVAC